MRRTIIADCKCITGQNKVRSDLHEGRHNWTKSTPLTSQGCGDLVPTSSHTTSGETSARAPRADVEKLSSVGICLDN